MEYRNIRSKELIKAIRPGSESEEVFAAWAEDAGLGDYTRGAKKEVFFESNGMKSVCLAGHWMVKEGGIFFTFPDFKFRMRYADSTDVVPTT